ncbi:hypothetical protein ARSEF4850_006899, partial [Beauveria asiatica]
MVMGFNLTGTQGRKLKMLLNEDMHDMLRIKSRKGQDETRRSTVNGRW